MIMLAAMALAAQSNDPVYVSTVRTSDLAHICESSSDLALDGCVGYVLATLDSLSMHRIICPTPGGNTTEQTMAIVRRYLSVHPELWNNHPSWVIEQVLRDAFPCR